MNPVKIVKEKGYFTSFFMGIFKIFMALYSHSWLIFIHAVYNIIKFGAGHYARRERAGHFNTMFYSGLLVIAASAVYLVYSIYIFMYGSHAAYHMYIAIGIAAVTTYELTVAIYGLQKARKSQQPQAEAVKSINLASSLISVSLTQTAILSYTNADMDMSPFYALGDAIFGLLALLVGIFMLFRANHLETENTGNG